jgi:hypothetical protein
MVFNVSAPDSFQCRRSALLPREWRRSGGESRNSASSRRVNSPRSCCRFFGGDPASGSRVGTPGGGSPLVSDAGRCAGLGAGRRTMLGSITTSFRPPTSTRCSILSRRTSLILRFPSSWTDSITPTRCDALRPRSHLSMFFLLTANAVQSSHQLWRRPQVLDDISGSVSTISRPRFSLICCGPLDDRMQFLQPHSSADGYASRRGNCASWFGRQELTSLRDRGVV